MERMFSGFTLGNLELLNRFVFPPVKLGAGRAGVEIAEKLGRESYEVVATKRADPIGRKIQRPNF